MPVVDTSIYNSRGIDPGQIADGYQQGLQIKGMQQQQQEAGIRLADMQRAQQAEILKRGAYTVDANGNPVVDPAGMAAYAKFDPMGKIAMDQARQQQQVAQQKADLELHHMKLGDMSDILRGANDEPSYQLAVKSATDKGYLHPGELPGSYLAATMKDPTTGMSPLEAHMNQALSLQDVIKNRQAEAELGVKKEEAAAKTSEAATAKAKLPIEQKKADAEAALAGPKMLGEIYGRSSPTNAIASEYEKELAPIRGSQVAMRQMIDNYNNPSPQGDKSLILNAFKIKFPTAPDVNSLEELSKAQSLPEQWRNMAHSAINGGLDQTTRDNLMRDGISTYRANYGTYKDVAQRYQGIAKKRGIPLGGLTDEPSLDNTFQKTQALQNKLNPISQSDALAEARRRGLIK